MPIDHSNAKSTYMMRSLRLLKLNSKSENKNTWPFVITTTIRKFFMAFISKVIKKRTPIFISRFDVPKIPPHMINQLGVEKEAMSTH